MKFRLHPIDRDIIRSISSLKLAVTPSKIAKTINVHPTTVQRHVKALSQKGILKCNMKGNRTYCKLERDVLKKGFN